MAILAIMKNVLILLALVMSLTSASAQSPFDEALKALANEVTGKISEKHIQNVAMTFFSEDDGDHERLGRYIDEEFAVYFINNRSRITVTDRFNTDRLLRMSKVIIEGTIDQRTVREFGRVSGVQAIMTGRFTVLENSVRVRVKVIDTASGNQIAATAASLPMDETVRYLIGKK